MAGHSNCQTCHSIIDPNPQEFKMRINGGPLLYSNRQTDCLSCAKSKLEKLFRDHGPRLMQLSGHGLIVNWSEFSGTEPQLRVLVAAGILVKEIEGSTQVKITAPNGDNLFLDGSCLIFARPTDILSYKAAHQKKERSKTKC